MKFVNLTPHSIMVADKNGEHAFAPDGTIARTTEATEPTASIGGFEIEAVRTGDVIGLPDPAPGTTFIVSMVVATHPAVRGRSDVVAPNTGPTAIRNDKGHILAVRGFRLFV